MSPSRKWPAAIMGLIGLNMAIVAATIYYATHDPSAAVEPDYYQKAVDWDRDSRVRAASDRLGWTAAVELAGLSEIALRLTDRDGRPVAGAVVEVEAFAEARASQRQRLVCSEAGPGRYVSPISVSRQGLWEFQVDARREGEHHLSTVQLDLDLRKPNARAEVRE